MSHVLLRSTATPDGGSAPSAVGSAQLAQALHGKGVKPLS
jgi:hypothetical protein